MENNVIITGIPRSGTTLTCFLLNKLPNTIALHEPMLIQQYANPYDHSIAVNAIDEFFKVSRASLISNRTAFTKNVNGKVPDNPTGSDFTNPIWLRILPVGNQIKSNLHARRKRKNIVQREIVKFNKNLTDEFMLAIKHPAAFVAILENLKQKFPIYAIIRNPLSTLASWNSVSYAVGKGRSPVAQKFDDKLQKSLDLLPDVIDRQFFLLNWFYEKISKYLPKSNVIKYEQIIATRGKCLSAINSRAIDLNEDLINRNINELYNLELMKKLGQRLLRSDGLYWRYYSQKDVEEILSDVEQQI